MEPIHRAATYTGIGGLGQEQRMQIAVWVLAGCGLLVAAAFLASVIDRRAGWNQIPLELDSSLEHDEVPLRRR
jgi:hypothetical protein